MLYMYIIYCIDRVTVILIDGFDFNNQRVLTLYIREYKEHTVYVA